jgi:hypothetical protein
MKPATARPATETSVTTITKETITAPEKPGMPEFWGYLESLKPEDWENHICYIYRLEPRAQESASGTYGSTALEKVVGMLEIRPGVSIPFNNKEEVELGIREKWGGKTFRLFLKRGSERISETRVMNEYPPKYPPSGAMNPGTQTGPTISNATESSNTADVAKTAIASIAGQEARATDVAIRALTGAAEVVTRLASADKPQPSAMDQAFQAVMIRMMEKSMTERDPLADITRVAELVKVLTPAAPAVTALSPNATGNPMLDRIMEAAIERILNPATVAGPVATASAELVRALPNVAGYIVEGIREWRIGAEAQRDTAAIMNGAPQRPAGVPAPQPPPRALPQTPPMPATPAGVQPVINIEFIEGKILEIFNEGAPAEDAADDTLTFLDRLAPELITTLAAQGETGLVNLFQTRPTLRPATNNMPRLVEFIRAFLRIASGQANQPPAGPPAVIPPNGTAKA